MPIPKGALGLPPGVGVPPRTRMMTKWTPVEVTKPTEADADAYGRVWAVAVDAVGRPYPCEASWRHVAEGRPVYTHWMRPEWGVDIKRRRRPEGS